MNERALGCAVLALVATCLIGVGTAHAQAEAKAATTPAESNEGRVQSIRQNEYFYQSYGRKDLFAALVTGEFEPQQAADLVDISTGKLVGVMWGPTDKFALVEDGQGNGYILRVGDRVQNGRVVAIQDKSVVANLTMYGMSSRVVLRLENREG